MQTGAAVDAVFITFAETEFAFLDAFFFQINISDKYMFSYSNLNNYFLLTDRCPEFVPKIQLLLKMNLEKIAKSL